MEKKIEVGILGATGTVGQRFVQLLEDHPWFELDLAGGERPQRRQALPRGRRLAARGRRRRARVAEHDRRGVRARARAAAGLLLHVLGAWPARSRPRLRRAPATSWSPTPATSAWPPDVPLLVPEINPGHLGLLPVQRRERGWSGAIVTNPNCAAVVLVDAARRPSPLRPQAPDGDHLPGGLGRRLPRRALARHPGQRHPLHRRRGGEGRERDPEDPGRSRRGTAANGGIRAPALRGQRRAATGCPRSTATWSR